MKKVLALAVIGSLLGLGAWADPVQVTLPSAEEEVAALQKAWAQVAVVLEGFIKESKSAIATLNSNDQDLQAKYRAVAVQLKDLEAKILQVQETSSTMKIDLETKLLQLQEATIRADKDLAGSIASLAERVEAIRTELSSALVPIGDKLNALASVSEAHEKRIATLEAFDLGSLSRRILSLEQATQALQIKIENNREKIGGLESTMAGFTGDLAALKDTVSLLQGTVDSHETRLSSVEATVEGLDVKALNDQLAMVQGMAIIGLIAGIASVVLLLTGALGG